MGRPSDWEDVFGFGDPTPGEVWDIRAVARSWGTVASHAGLAESKLRGLLGDDALVTWIGDAGEQFRSRSSDLPDQLGKVEDSYQMASDAMYWWAGRLDLHQGKADGALVDGRDAKADLASAETKLDAANGDVWQAGGLPALTAMAPSPEQVQHAQDKLDAARNAQSSAQGLVDNAEARLSAARSLAEDARESRESDARETARRIHDAADAGVPPRSRWEKFKDGASAAWDVLVTIAKVVVAVLGVVVLIIGGPLAWVVFAAALIVLADSLLKYAKGEGSLLDVGLAALGCIPGTKGLTTLSKLSAAFKSGGTLGATAHVLGAGRTAIVSMARSVRSMGPGLRTAVARFTDRGLSRMDDFFRGGQHMDTWMDVRSTIHAMRGGEFTTNGDLVLRRWTMASDVPGPLTGDGFLAGTSRDVGFPANTFQSASYNEVMSASGTNSYRAVTHGSNLNGPFWTLEPPTGGLQTQLDSALLPEWQSTSFGDGGWVTNPQATHFVEATLPPGTTYFQGPAGMQVGQTGSLVGGGDQLFVPDIRNHPEWLSPGVARVGGS